MKHTTPKRMSKENKLYLNISRQDNYEISDCKLCQKGPPVSPALTLDYMGLTNTVGLVLNVDSLINITK